MHLPKMIVNYRSGTLANAAEWLNPLDMVFYSVEDGHALIVDIDLSSVYYLLPDGDYHEIDRDSFDRLLDTGRFMQAVNCPASVCSEEDDDFGYYNKRANSRYLGSKLSVKGNTVVEIKGRTRRG